MLLNTVGVVVNPSPTVSVNSGSVCAGNYFVMNPSGASTYTFSSMTPSVTPSVNTTYTVIGKSAQGCLSSNVAISSVMVNPIPIITVNSGTICSGETFTMTPGGGSLYVYSGGSDLVSPTTTTGYTVTGSDANGCINTATSSVSVGGTATSITVNSGTICTGASFTIIPSGASTYSYSSGTAVVSPSVSSDYTVTATSATSCISTVSVVCSVIVNQTPTVSVNSGTICSGNNFIMVPTGASTYTFSNGSNSISPVSNTVITVTGTDVNGCEDNVGALSSIFVNANPVITTSVSSSVICDGSSAELTAKWSKYVYWCIVFKHYYYANREYNIHCSGYGCK